MKNCSLILMFSLLFKRCFLYAGIMAMALLGACSDKEEPVAEEDNDEYAYLKDVDATAWANEVSQELHGGAVTVTLMACDEDFNPKNDFREDENVCFLLKYKNNTDKTLVLSPSSMGHSGVSENIYFPYQCPESTTHEFFMCLFHGEEAMRLPNYFMPLVPENASTGFEKPNLVIPVGEEAPSQPDNWYLSSFINYFLWPVEADSYGWKRPAVQKGIYTAVAYSKDVIFYEGVPYSSEWPDYLIPQELFKADINLSVTFIVR